MYGQIYRELLPHDSRPLYQIQVLFLTPYLNLNIKRGKEFWVWVELKFGDKYVILKERLFLKWIKSMLIFGYKKFLRNILRFICNEEKCQTLHCQCQL